MRATWLACLLPTAFAATLVPRDAPGLALRDSMSSKLQILSVIFKGEAEDLTESIRLRMLFEVDKVKTIRYLEVEDDVYGTGEGDWDKSKEHKLPEFDTDDWNKGNIEDGPEFDDDDWYDMKSLDDDITSGSKTVFSYFDLQKFGDPLAENGYTVPRDRVKYVKAKDGSKLVRKISM